MVPEEEQIRHSNDWRIRQTLRGGAGVAGPPSTSGGDSLLQDTSHRRSQQRSLREPLPQEWHLARVALGSFDMKGAVREVRGVERSRHQRSFNAVEPPKVERTGGPFGNAPIRRRMRQSLSTPSVMESLSEASTPSDAGNGKKTKGPEHTAFVDPQDPCDFPNQHIARIDALAIQINKQERLLSESRGRCLANRFKAEDSSPASPQTFNFDHQMFGPDNSEYELQFYPKSLEALRECGGGKDKRFTRPYDDHYQFREAWCKQKICLGS